jgi:hypothetical protein
MKRNIIFLSVIVFSLSLLQGCGLLKIGVNKPAKLSFPSIRDGEYVIYNNYDKGELSEIDYYVSTIDSNSNITMFAGWTNLITRVKLPLNYSNFEERLDFSFQYKTLVHSRDYWLPAARLEGKKGNVGTDLEIDLTNLKAEIKDYSWDGINITVSTGKMGLKKGYSYWDMDSFGMIGLRFIKPEKGGIAYIITSGLAKDPVPVSFRYYGRETVVVPAGIFKTKKYGFVVADPFLNGLLGRFANESFVWIENSPRALLVKANFMGDYLIKLLREGIWK